MDTLTCILNVCECLCYSSRLDDRSVIVDEELNQLQTEYVVDSRKSSFLLIDGYKYYGLQCFKIESDESCNGLLQLLYRFLIDSLEPSGALMFAVYLTTLALNVL